MNEPKVIRIEVEYEDGVIEQATGNVANEIWDRIQGMCVMEHIHGRPYSGPQLKRRERPGAALEKGDIDI